MAETTDQPAADRRSRRKAETRTKLIEAARRVFARQGIDATRINEITEEADVGFGSFYNYFESKDAIVDAVLEQVARDAGAAIDEATRDLDDPAEVMSVAHRSLVDRAATDPEFGWILVRLDVSHDIGFAALRAYAARDLDNGIKAGRFHVDDPETALIAAGGALFSVIRAVLMGRATQRAGQSHAAGILRMLGLAREDAAEVARRPLPKTSSRRPAG